LSITATGVVTTADAVAGDVGRSEADLGAGRGAGVFPRGSCVYRDVAGSTTAGHQITTLTATAVDRCLDTPAGSAAAGSTARRSQDGGGEAR